MSSIQNTATESRKVSISAISGVGKPAGAVSALTLCPFHAGPQRRLAFDGTARSVREALAKERYRIEAKNERRRQARLQAEQQQRQI